MKKLFSQLIFIVCLFITAGAQIAGGEPISNKDSLLFNKFWQHFKQAIDQKDKINIEKSFQFPFSCSPCLDYAAPTDSFGTTLKVTRRIFRETVYKTFFDLPKKNASAAQWKEGPYFLRTGGKNDKSSFMFSFVIIPPSKTFEGIQGFIYVDKVNGEYLIDGADTVP